MRKTDAGYRVSTCACMGVVIAMCGGLAHAAGPAMAPGEPVDIASSAYQYRADRAAGQNAPESWLALMRYAHQPLNKPADTNALAIKRVLSGLLWEEIRPIQTLELSWPADAKRRPAAEDLEITTLINKGTASSWWNNLEPAQHSARAAVSSDSLTYTWNLAQNTCGIVISVTGSKPARDFDVPVIRVITDDRWKQMNVELEWGFDTATDGNDYSGRIETYDGAVTELASLEGDRTTTVESRSWHSVGNANARRGVRFKLLYMGTSKWRRVQPFTSQPDDVARTIVTVWTAAGNFSFLAADLDNGPILAPEFGFFVRRASGPSTLPTSAPDARRTSRKLLDQKMKSIAGSSSLVGWGTESTPWFGGNPGDQTISASGITLPPSSVAMHPSPDRIVAAGWRSPMKGRVRFKASVAHAQTAGNGVEWRLIHESRNGIREWSQGTTTGNGTESTPDSAANSTLTVEPEDMISLTIGAKGDHSFDTTIVQFIIAEVGGRRRVWNLTDDVVKTLHAGNPHADGYGNADVWRFYTDTLLAPSEPPFPLASEATSAAAFLKELQSRNLSTIRRQIRRHDEQTWEGAVTAMRGGDLPLHPKPPAGSEPVMQVEVPSERMTAQWNLGAWHLLRHCETNPQTGRRWFNDYPYGILGAETYMVLAVLDLMGAHQAAEDGFEQWVSLPLDNTSAGHHSWSLPDRPSGLFSDGHGCLTFAVGPKGAGGHMDAVHAFGPGSIGWALAQHYWLTGDKEWLKRSAPRINAGAEWMLRQRQVVAGMVPGGERLWCKGLQPALQVTPDSGGLWMQFYECEAYYWIFLSRFADALFTIDPEGGAKLKADVDAYRKDLLAAVDRSIALSPVVPVRDGTFHSVVPFACYVRGLSTGAWGWQRDGSGAHVGPLYWETVQSAAALISPAGLLNPSDVRVQGYLDVLEDRLLLENSYVGNRDWFAAGWQYQGGLERTSNMHLASDDIPVFLRSFFNGYAIDILPDQGYIFNEHAVHGPPDKIFEEAAFLERFRNLLLMEEGDSLWLARATPRAWLAQGQKISVKNAPTQFGVVNYQIVSDVDHGRITATIDLPARRSPATVKVRFRHPASLPIRSATINGADSTAFEVEQEMIQIQGKTGAVIVEARY